MLSLKNNKCAAGIFIKYFNVFICLIWENKIEIYITKVILQFNWQIPFNRLPGGLTYHIGNVVDMKNLIVVHVSLCRYSIRCMEKIIHEKLWNDKKEINYECCYILYAIQRTFAPFAPSSTTPILPYYQSKSLTFLSFHLSIFCIFHI